MNLNDLNNLNDLTILKKEYLDHRQNEDEKNSSVYDEIFAFDRTASRLLEMQSEQYVEKCLSLHLDGIQWLQKQIFYDIQTNSDTDMISVVNKLIDEMDKCTIEMIYKQYNWGRNIDIDMPVLNARVFMDDIIEIAGKNLQQTKERENLYLMNEESSINYIFFEKLIKSV